MSKINDGGPAFPKTYGVSNGMTLRDWFAGQMLCGFGAAFANMIADDGASVEAMEPAAKGMALTAYAFADAMLAERERSS